VVFDHVTKSMIVCASAPLRGDHRDAALARALAVEIDRIEAAIEADSVRLQPGRIDDDANAPPSRPVSTTTPPGAFRAAVERAKEYIRAGDAFQVVLSQRFERTTATDPFDLYRMLRVVNPSPYQAYLQGEGCILVASSPEILCRVRDGTVTNRPLAGTRRRGSDEAEDARLERELLADAKERAEHVMGATTSAA
jgi:anthranilate synthase component 1